VSAYSRQNLTSYIEGNTTFYNLNGTIYAAANLTDPVKEYWEYVCITVYAMASNWLTTQWHLPMR
jgi:hypothetical protein